MLNENSLGEQKNEIISLIIQTVIVTLSVV